MRESRRALLGFATAAAAVALAACAEAPARPTISQGELLARMASDQAPLILDVRTPAEFASGHVPGAVNVPHTEVADRIGELGPPGRHVVVYCRSGRRSALAVAALRDAGFASVLHLEGDMQAWRAADLPCEGC